MDLRQVRVDIGRPIRRLLRILRQEMMVFRIRMVALEMRKDYELERILGCSTSGLGDNGI